MLVYGQEILNKASKECYGVGAFNFVNFEMLNAIFVAADSAKSPIFVQASEGAIKYMGIDMAVNMVKTMRRRDEYAAGILLERDPQRTGRQSPEKLRIQ